MLSESHRAKVLAAQVERRRDATAIRAYCEALEHAHTDDDAVAEWITWARSHADHIDPLDPAPALPDRPTDVSPKDHEPFLGSWRPCGPQVVGGRWT